MLNLASYWESYDLLKSPTTSAQRYDTNRNPRKNQRSMQEPPDSKTSLTRLRISEKSFLIVFKSIDSHSFTSLALKSWKDVNLILFNLVCTIPHKFSIGLRSGLLGGQGRTLMLRYSNTIFVFLLVWAEALSCWNIQEFSYLVPLNNNSAYGST